MTEQSQKIKKGGGFFSEIMQFIPLSPVFYSAVKVD